MNLLGRKSSGSGQSPEAKQAQLVERQQKAALRNARMAQTREARKACGALKSPEPLRGVYAGLVLLAIAVFSYLSKDVAQETVTVHHKSVIKSVPYPPHPSEALLLAVLALVTIGSIYFKRRLATVIAFMVTAAVGVDVPLPLADADLRWVAFLVPAGYALWIYAFRMRKDQTAWLAKHPLPGDASSRGSAARGAAGSRGGQGTGPRGGQKASAGAARARRAKDEPVISATGRPLPASTGRYTRPKGKPRPSKTGTAQPGS